MIPRNDFENSNEQGTSTTTTTTATDITVMTSEQMTSSDVQRVEGSVSNLMYYVLTLLETKKKKKLFF